MAKEKTGELTQDAWDALQSENEALRKELVDKQTAYDQLLADAVNLREGNSQLAKELTDMKNTSPPAFDETALQDLQEENEALRSQLEKSQGENRALVARHAAQLQDIRNSVEHGGAVVIRPLSPVDGVFEAVYNDPKNGKEVRRSVKFADGQRRVRMADGELVSSAALMRIAEGGEATPDEVLVFPALVKVTQDAAAARLTDLVKINYPGLVDA